MYIGEPTEDPALENNW